MITRTKIRGLVGALGLAATLPMSAHAAPHLGFDAILHQRVIDAPVEPIASTPHTPSMPYLGWDAIGFHQAEAAATDYKQRVDARAGDLGREGTPSRGAAADHALSAVK